MLLAKVKDPLQTDQSGHNMIMLIVKENNLEMLKHFALTQNASEALSKKNKDGHSILHIAAKHASVEVIDFLIEMVPEELIEERCHNHLTPFLTAVIWKQYDLSLIHI